MEEILKENPYLDVDADSDDGDEDVEDFTEINTRSIDESRICKMAKDKKRWYKRVC